MTRERELYELWMRKIPGNTELNGISGDDAEIKDRFYRDLEFGTAGLRGVLGLGTNRMNVYTVGRATQGLSDYLMRDIEKPVVAIAYDSRINSDIFAKEAAGIFAANGIKAYIYKELMPTPALSFAVRNLGCDAGVVITASHNPAKYNGYKAYGNDGCQIGPETADAVLENIAKTDIFTGVRRMDFEEGLKTGLIEFIPESFVQQYIDRVFQEAIDPEVCGDSGLKIVYTPLNGAGNRCVRTILKKLGVEDVIVVPEQENPDGNFPTCPYPNPEKREALELGLALCEKEQADLLLATDPDADRMAVAAKTANGYQILTGNEIGVLLLDYIATARKAKGTMPQKPVAVKSIVSTKLADAVAAEHGVELVSVLTGFKYIGEVILGLEQKGEESRFIFGFEESCGYLTGGYVRDKDAVDASLILVEAASALKKRGQTLPGRLSEIYKKHGIYLNRVESFAFEGADGKDKMTRIMAELHENPPEELGGAKVVTVTDYEKSTRVTFGIDGPTATVINLPKADVIELGLENRCSVIIRPSGTEPNIKIYYSLVADTAEEAEALAKLYAKECRGVIDN
jgi:phosphoglucomutase